MTALVNRAGGELVTGDAYDPRRALDFIATYIAASKVSWALRAGLSEDGAHRRFRPRCSQIKAGQLAGHDVSENSTTPTLDCVARRRTADGCTVVLH